MQINLKILEQYRELSIDYSVMNNINQELKITRNKLSAMSHDRRLALLYESLSWEKGLDQENRIVTSLYELPLGYNVAIAKPGKEAASDYRGCRFYAGERKGEKTNNPNDMNPHILRFGEKVGKDLTFEDMFDRIENLMHSDLFGLEIMGMLLFRAAFMLDHEKNEDGNWRYFPPKSSLELLETRIPQVGGIPIRVLLHFLEVLSLNEDVKVHTLGYTDLKHDYGRINTLLTFVHLIAVLLNRRSLAKFAGSFARPPSGMAPIPKTKIGEFYPLLSPDGAEFIAAVLNSAD